MEQNLDGVASGNGEQENWGGTLSQKVSVGLACRSQLDEVDGGKIN